MAPRQPVTRSSPRPSRSAARPSGKAATIDEYLERVSGERREALEQLRATIRGILPRAVECISYGLPAFRLDGEVVAGFAATAKGCSYYPFSSTTLVTLRSEVRAYVTTKGALQFDAGKPLPSTLVRKLIKARLAER